MKIVDELQQAACAADVEIRWIRGLCWSQLKLAVRDLRRWNWKPPAYPPSADWETESDRRDWCAIVECHVLAEMVVLRRHLAIEHGAALEMELFVAGAKKVLPRARVQELFNAVMGGSHD